MKQEEIKQKAFNLYAAIGELTVRKKQLLQQLENLNKNIEAFEVELVELSKIKIEEENNEE